ncbi:MAG TPA: prepilin-type N-terminal cleavage/methylation domain-containing protein [Blastocatellia bacterium]|nr:prepilin-type N-terminal cleavage/methylation domain-containing protein [Blastocatellia bacterium]
MNTLERPMINHTSKGLSERGFSMIEMLIAICVITFGLVSIVGVSAYVSRTNATSNILGLLTTTAQAQADKLRGAIWNTGTEDPKLTVGGDVNYDSSDNNHRATVVDTPAGTLNVSWKVIAGPGTTGDMRTITMKVVQVGAPARLADGVTITMIISQG